MKQEKRYYFFQTIYKKIYHKSNNKKVLIDCFSVNFGKPIHFGHVRSGIFGNIINRMMKYIGYTSKIDSHYGDYGLNLGMYLNYFINNKIDIKNISITELIKIYKELNLKKEIEDFSEILIAFENRDKKCIEIYKKIKLITCLYIERVKKLFSIEIDYENGESKYIELCRYIEKHYNCLFYRDENNRLITKEGNIVLTRKNNTPIYAFTDIATLLERERIMDIDLVIYCVDERQSFHLESIFKFCKEHMKLIIETIHKKFGVVKKSKDEIFKSRSGNETFDIIQFIKDISEDMNICEETIADAMVYYDIRHKSNNQYIFDINVIHNFIIEYFKIKEKINNIKINNSCEENIELIIHMLKTKNVISYASERLDPHIIYLHWHKIISYIRNKKEIIMCEKDYEIFSYCYKEIEKIVLNRN